MSMDNEILVINEVYQALKELPTQDSMIRVLEWVCSKLYIRATFELPRKEKLLRQGREFSGYVPKEEKQEESIPVDWEEQAVEEVADFDSDDAYEVEPEDEKDD